MLRSLVIMKERARRVSEIVEEQGREGVKARFVV